VLAYFVFAEP